MLALGAINHSDLQTIVDEVGEPTPSMVPNSWIDHFLKNDGGCYNGFTILTTSITRARGQPYQ